MSFSTLPFLFALQLLFWISLTHTAHGRQQLTDRQARSILVWLAILVLWGFATSMLAICGVYSSPALLRSLPGLWLPLVPMILSASLYVSSTTFRDAIHGIVTVTPSRTFIFIQVLRITAIGGLYKATHDLMPLIFTASVGIPDFLYGVSALVLVGITRYRRVSLQLLGVWHIVGIAVIVITAPFVLQLSLPGPWYIFQTLPDGRALLEFPMVLAPTLVVPFFILTNAIAAYHLLRKSL
ncbi:MAG: hypothetical protein PHR16_14000 [Methylovulum sp.]|nr:hypothetical protein [Methylovulum sp.]